MTIIAITGATGAVGGRVARALTDLRTRGSRPGPRPGHPTSAARSGRATTPTRLRPSLP